jgi:hypothetical protein
VARACAGNFLVAREACRHLQSGLRPDELSEFLRRLAKTRGPEQLGTIYPPVA